MPQIARLILKTFQQVPGAQCEQFLWYYKSIRSVHLVVVYFGYQASTEKTRFAKKTDIYRTCLNLRKNQSIDGRGF